MPAERPAALTERDVARLLSVTVSCVRAWRLRGGGPSFLRMGRAVRYRIEDVDRFMASRTVRREN
jgi:predicted DNA-binding transcriptional regulator AlpA